MHQKILGCEFKRILNRSYSSISIPVTYRDKFVKVKLVERRFKMTLSEFR